MFHDKKYFVNRMETIVKFVKMVKELDNNIGVSLEGNLYQTCFDLINEMEDEYEVTSVLDKMDATPLIGDWVWEYGCGEHYKGINGEERFLVEMFGIPYRPKTPEELYDVLSGLYGY